MPKTATLFSLPKEILKELHQRLKQSGYTQFIELSDWLKSLGYNISKSALHRYAVKLKANDGFTEKGGSVSLAVKMNDTGEFISSLDDLYRELGFVEYQKHQILRKISELKAEIHS